MRKVRQDGCAFATRRAAVVRLQSLLSSPYPAPSEIPVNLNLKGRAALVTGASAGIGRAIALELAREGAQLVITGRRKDALAEVAAEIGKLAGTPATTVAHDALDEDYVEAVAASAMAALGSIEILINNAVAAARSARTPTKRSGTRR
jgi:NAD(P)-dependent dehydrogenase (short-subunit alcohol dehydrogenase family)